MGYPEEESRHRYLWTPLVHVVPILCPQYLYIPAPFREAFDECGHFAHFRWQLGALQ